MDRDNYMTAEQAMEWGLIDQIVSRREQPVRVQVPAGVHV
jgi:ATP-dependent protease ClpP protease subunit